MSLKNNREKGVAGEIFSWPSIGSITYNFKINGIRRFV